MKPTLKFDDFVGLYRTVVAKDDYERKTNDYYGLPVLRRAFARRPADPARGMETFHLHNMLDHAFRCVFPEFADVTISDGQRLDAHTAHCEFSFDRESGMPLLRLEVHDNTANTVSSEQFEYRKGYGFVHAYKHDDDPKMDATFRLRAFQQAMDYRIDKDWAQRIYSKFDRFRSSDEVRQAWGSPRVEYDLLPQSERRRMAEGLKAATEAVNGRLDVINKAQEEKKLAEVQGTYKVRSLDDYVGNARAIRDMALETMRDPEKNTPDYRALVEVRMDANKEVTDAALYSFAMDEVKKYLSEKHPSKKGALDPIRIPSFDELLDYAYEHVYVYKSVDMYKDRTQHTDEAYMRKVYDRFVSAAVWNGYDLDDIRSFVYKDIHDEAHPKDFTVDRTDYEGIKAENDRHFREVTHRDVANGESFIFVPVLNFPTPLDTGKRVCALKRFIQEDAGFIKLDIKKDKDKLRAEAEIIGETLFETDMSDKDIVVTPKMFDYFGVDSRKVQAGFDKAFGRRFSYELSKGIPMEKDFSKKNGETVFRNQVIDAVNFLQNEIGASQNNPDESFRQLGTFLRKLGVETSNGKPMAENFNDAIYGLYGRGGKEDFRQKFSDVFGKARAFAKEHSPRQKEEVQKVRKNSGPKLG